MKFIKVLTLIILPLNAYSKNLEEIYEIAKVQDPTYNKAEATFLGIKENLPQALALSLPTLSASATNNANKNSTAGGFNSRSYQLDLSQDIFNPSNIIEYQKTKFQVLQAQSTFEKAKQDLILSVTKQYFRILKAKNDVDFNKAKLSAFSKHLQQTEQRFNVGLTAITNVHEAKARRDDANAQLIAAENTLSNQYESLNEIIGQQVDHVDDLVHSKVQLSMPSPNNMEKWVQMSLDNNLALIAQKHKVEQERYSIRKQQAGHLPTLGLNGSIAKSKTTDPFSTTKTVGLSLSVPIFSGGTVISKTEQAVQSLAQAQSDYVRIHRGAESSTRKAFRGIKTQLSEIHALEQATISNQSALKATESAFDVGTRTMVDVLNAQSELLEARKKLNNAHYDFILESLQLKASAGSLTEADIVDVNKWLKKA